MDEQKIRGDRARISRHLEEVDQCVTEVYQTVDEHSTSQPKLLLNYLEALAKALEELRVAEEEICLQNQELHQTRQALESERYRYQTLFEFAPDGYLITDIQGKIQEVNLAAAELFNIDKKYLVGKILTSFVPEDQRRVFRSLLLQLRTVDRIQEWEINLLARNKLPFEAATTVSAVRNAEGVTSLRWLVRDITARKQMENQLRQIQLQNLELIEADRLKAQFIATMSHELRTPLNAILGFSDLLLRQFHRKFEPQQLNMMERIFQNGRHLLTLIEDILDFSKLRSKQLELELEEFDLGCLVTATVEEMRSLKDHKNLDIQVQLPEERLSVTNDRKRLRQMLVNLLSNAIKFTDEGLISVEVEPWRNGRVAIVVRDTGIGIAEPDLNFIFQEFRQANQTVTRSHGGTGLGLAITKALADLMVGEISVVSQIGRGSTFLVEIPRRVTPSNRERPKV